MGRRARLELVFARRAGRTVLAHAYAEPPYRVGRWFEEGDAARVILAMAAPGAFGGDVLQQSVRVAPGARVRLTSQSAMQVHPTACGGTARLSSAYEVADGAELRCDWDPLIPFAGARLDYAARIRLAPDARLLWSDALMAGRASAALARGGADPPAGPGERWAFVELTHELEVTRGAALEYLERYRLAPREREVDGEWAAGPATHVGTVLASGWPTDLESLAALHRELGDWRDVRAAADRLDGHLTLVRLMATGGAQFREARQHANRRLAGVWPGCL